MPHRRKRPVLKWAATVVAVVALGFTMASLDAAVGNGYDNDEEAR